jgi:hypothetical protein
MNPALRTLLLMGTAFHSIEMTKIRWGSRWDEVGRRGPEGARGMRSPSLILLGATILAVFIGVAPAAHASHTITVSPTLNTCDLAIVGGETSAHTVTYQVTNNTGEPWSAAYWCKASSSNQCVPPGGCSNPFLSYTGPGSASFSPLEIDVTQISIPPGGVYVVTIPHGGTIAECKVLMDPVCASELPPAVLSFDDPGTHGDVVVGSFVDVIYTVTNTGSVDATSMVFSGLAAEWSSPATTCTTSLNNGGSCTYTVRFTPSTTGSFVDTLLLDYDDGGGPAATVSIPVSGEGIAPSIPALGVLPRAGLAAMLMLAAVGAIRRRLAGGSRENRRRP